MNKCQDSKKIEMKMEQTTTIEKKYWIVCGLTAIAETTEMKQDVWHFIGITCASTANDHANLHESLFKDYKKFVRPVRNQSEALQVNISFFIIMIHDLDLKNQVLTTNAWFRVSWYDEFLQWDKDKYGGLSEVLVDKSEVWAPDLLVENTANGYQELGIPEMKINLDSHGLLIWEPGIVMQTICEVSIYKYPFDRQHCAIRVMSWMHTNKMIHVHVEKDTVDTTGYYPNGEWDLTETKVRDYSPEDGSYNEDEILPGAKAILQLRRKPVFYILSTILPISMLSLLNLLVFLLPSNTGEKMTLAVTVLLSFTVFMSVVNEIMPKTSNSVSILAVYLTFLLCMSGFSVASTVWVLYVHHRDFQPNWLRRFSTVQRYSDVHETKLHRVKRPYSSRGGNNNNNQRITAGNIAIARHSSINGIPTSISHRHLLEKEADSDKEEFETEVDVVEDSRCSCLRDCSWFKQKLCWCCRQKMTKRLDVILFSIVAVLTVLATLVMLILLIQEDSH